MLRRLKHTSLLSVFPHDTSKSGCPIYLNETKYTTTKGAAILLLLFSHFIFYDTTTLLQGDDTSGNESRSYVKATNKRAVLEESTSEGMEALDRVRIQEWFT